MMVIKITAKKILLVAALAVLAFFPFQRTELQRTGNPFDVAMDGPGYFQILIPSGEFRYTRDGAFRLNARRQLVTTDGYLVQPAIAIPEDTQTITIANDGSVSVVTVSAPNKATCVGILSAARFPNAAGLQHRGHHLMAETSASGAAITSTPGQQGIGRLEQGCLEVRTRYSVLSELTRFFALEDSAYAGPTP